MSEDLPSSPRGRREVHKSRSRRENVRLVTVATVSALAALFAVLNLEEVEVNWIIGTWDTPLIVVVALSMVLGAGLGFLVARRRSATKSTTKSSTK
jgi:uncharacterized integral membrane protein